MKRSLFIILILCAALALIFWSAGKDAYAVTYEFSPDITKLNLEHDFAYTWGISQSLDPNEIITEATLVIYNVNNWKVEQNVLYINLLDTAPLKVKKYNDKNDGNFFAGQGLLLDEYIDTSSATEDYTYHFDQTELVALNNALQDGVVGFGLDPDCHYNYSGLTFQVQTESIPEPAAVILLGAGLSALAFFRRYNHRK
jgi:hypothetical protein